VWITIGYFIARGPQPQILVPGETLWQAGSLPITNTLFTAWVAMILIIVGAFFATRSMKLLPSGWQNFIESGFGWVYGQIVEIAGETNGKRFFTLTATIFFFILVANWLALLPFFNAIGKTEDVGHEIFHEFQEKDPSKLSLNDKGVYDDSHKFGGSIIGDSGGVFLVKPAAKGVDFTVNNGDTPATAADRYYVFLADKFTNFNIPKGESIDNPSAATVKAAAKALADDPNAPKLVTGEAHGGEEGIHSTVLNETVTGVDFSHSDRFATVIPLFRSAFSDVTNVLALTLISFLMVEYWGFKQHGFGYLKKFFDFRNPLAFFIGILELISELARIISLTFRLFGNVFGGEVLSLMITFLVPFLVVEFAYGLEIFEGFIQAGIFAVLTLLFAVLAVQSHGEEEHEQHHEASEPTTTVGTAQAQ
jgi:F0F1-type ATP synthase membrane subunit a